VELDSKTRLAFFHQDRVVQSNRLLPALCGCDKEIYLLSSQKLNGTKSKLRTIVLPGGSFSV